MIEIAWAAVRTKGSYYKDKYYRLKSRRGTKRAIERDINMIGQPSAQQIVGIDHVNETTISQG